MAADQVLGAAGLSLSLLIFVYYTTWALVTPFVAADAWLHSLFPARWWATAGPTALLGVALAGAGTFLSLSGRR